MNNEFKAAGTREVTSFPAAASAIAGLIICIAGIGVGIVDEAGSLWFNALCMLLGLANILAFVAGWSKRGKRFLPWFLVHLLLLATAIGSIALIISLCNLAIPLWPLIPIYLFALAPHVLQWAFIELAYRKAPVT